MTLALVDYGAGNLTSVIKAFRHLGADIAVVTAASQVAAAQAIVVPGVGNFGATATLDHEWRTAIRTCLDRGGALLGICLGLQWLFDGSEEAPELPGLGLFPGQCALLRADVKVPHVGWNRLERTGAASRILEGIGDADYTYFTHSFAAPEVTGTVARTRHGVAFTSVVEDGRVFGAQFHPEKSGATGLRLLANFLRAAAETR